MKKIVLSVLLVAGLCLTAQATSDSWKLDAAGVWTNPASWTGGNVPGITNGTTSTDVATFAVTLTTNRVVTVDANRNIAGITFQNAANKPGTNNSTTVGYTLSGGTINLSNGGLIQVLAEAVAGTGTNNTTVASPIVIQGDGGSATIKNDSSSGASGLLITGTISGNSTAGNTTTLTLEGTSPATGIGATARNNTVAIISDGTNGGNLKVVKNGTGLWTMGVASTFTGGLDINGGTIRYFGSSSIGLGRGLITIGSAGATLNHANSAFFTTTNDFLFNGNLTLAGAANFIFSGAMNLNAGVRTITVNANTNTTLLGTISNGSFIKAGADPLTLSGSNTYSGATTISAGELIANADHVFSGTTNITVAGAATLTLKNGVLNDYIGKNAKLVLNSTAILNLNFTGADTIGGLSLDGGTTWIPNGTYTAAQLDALPGATVNGGASASLTVGAKVLRLIGITSP